MHRIIGYLILYKIRTKSEWAFSFLSSCLDYSQGMFAGGLHLWQYVLLVFFLFSFLLVLYNIKSSDKMRLKVFLSTHYSVHVRATVG